MPGSGGMPAGPEAAIRPICNNLVERVSIHLHMG
ncbi:hypothetical protein phiRKBJ001_97 [Streptomyces phage phiRKBJ001]|nr:hypothetical protein phiRKBJ001_97 [Streptomyces phage phiRKBJ001]